MQCSGQLLLRGRIQEEIWILHQRSCQLVPHQSQSICLAVPIYRFVFHLLSFVTGQQNCVQLQHQVPRKQNCRLFSQHQACQRVDSTRLWLALPPEPHFAAIDWHFQSCRRFVPPCLYLSFSQYLFSSVLGRVGSDHESKAKYLIYKLKHLFFYLSEEEKKAISDSLLACGSRLIGVLSLDMVGIPFICSVEPVPFVFPFISTIASADQPNRTEGRFAVHRKVAGQQKRGFDFIVRGKSTAKKGLVKANPWESGIVWVENEIVKLKITFENLMNFPIAIESITLNTSGCSFESYSQSFVVPPSTSPNNNPFIILTGKTLQSGTLYIHACNIRAFNLNSVHPIDTFGLPLTSFDILYCSLIWR